MKLILLAGSLLGVPPILAETAGGVDVGSLLAQYGTAAPFAALAFWIVVQSRKDRDTARAETAEARAETAAARAETKQVRDDSLAREREMTSRLAPMLYDGGLLFDRGTARLAQAPSPSELSQVTEALQELARKLDER